MSCGCAILISVAWSNNHYWNFYTIFRISSSFLPALVFTRHWQFWDNLFAIKRKNFINNGLQSWWLRAMSLFVFRRLLLVTWYVCWQYVYICSLWWHWWSESYKRMLKPALWLTRLSHPSGLWQHSAERKKLKKSMINLHVIIQNHHVKHLENHWTWMSFFVVELNRGQYTCCQIMALKCLFIKYQDNVTSIKLCSWYQI